jgi:hypothetical protein
MGLPVLPMNVESVCAPHSPLVADLPSLFDMRNATRVVKAYIFIQQILWGPELGQSMRYFEIEANQWLSYFEITCAL